jgi:predicted peroxiredoxin
MANKLLVLMGNTDLSKPSEVGLPLFQATVAASMGFEVEVVLSGRASELAMQGVASGIPIQEDSPKSVYDYIRDAHEAGVKFKICTATLELLGDDQFIQEIEETVGGAYVISEAMSDGTVTLSY